jgi:hypothetical protein
MSFPARLAFILMGSSVLSCTPPERQDTGVESLDKCPPTSQIRFRAGSWKKLLKVARPSATLERTVMLWCREESGGGWSFDVASPFLVISEPHEEWMVLEPPDEWLNTPFEGLFVSSRCVCPTRIFRDGAHSYAERLGGSPEWGEVYKIGGTAVPGGNHANTSVLVLLAWHRPEGDWRILWSGWEAPCWSMGSYGVIELVEFSVRPNSSGEGALPFTLTATHRYTKWPTFDLDENPHLLMTFERKGILRGAPPMKMAMRSPWLYGAEKPESWEQIARKLAFYTAGSEDAIQRLARQLKQSNPAISREVPGPGDVIEVSDSESP